MEPKQKPSVGRVVHFSFSGHRLPAVITHVWSETCVNVAVLGGGLTAPVGAGYEHSSSVLAEETPESASMPNGMMTPHGSWSWPPRV